MVLFLRQIGPKLDSFVKKVSDIETVMGIGLFGSWARYEFSLRSNVDILIVDESDRNFDFNELLEFENFIFDVSRIPLVKLRKIVMPSMDHLLYGMHILYDPKKVLERVKKFEEEKFRTIGRIELRFENKVVTADSRLSRASSALSRKNFETALLFSFFSISPIAEVLIDLAGLPLTTKSMIWNLRRACEKLDDLETYNKIIKNLNLYGADKNGVLKNIKISQEIWHSMSEDIIEKYDKINNVPDNINHNIKYLTNALMTKKINFEIADFLKNNNFFDAIYRLRFHLFRLIVFYARIITLNKGNKFDYTSIFKTIKESTQEIHEQALQIFGFINYDPKKIRKIYEENRSFIMKFRKQRLKYINKILV
jgi:predicted nucleotidyltransferase